MRLNKNVLVDEDPSSQVSEQRQGGIRLMNSTGRKLLLGAVALAATCGLSYTTANSGSAATLAETQSPRIFFSNGGRIVSVREDGSDRRILTRENTRPNLRGLGDYDPELSPSGESMIFTRWSVRSGGLRSDLLEADSESGKVVRRLVRSDIGGVAGATWVPDGKSVLVSEIKLGPGRLASNDVYLKDLESGYETSLYKKDLSPKNPRYASAPDVVSDGSKFIYTIRDTKNPDSSKIVVREIGGPQLLVIEDSSGGVWSPDGQQIAMSLRDRDGEPICSVNGTCHPPSHLAITDGDGSNLKQLTRFRSNLSSPSWSPDGTRLAFQSDRTVPGESVASEVYVVRADGSCLDWLTNGSPESIDPSWGHSQSANPGSCGVTPRDPLLEIEPDRNIPAPGNQMLWAGRRFGNHLLSGVRQSRWSLDITYADCPNFVVSQCGQPMAIAGASRCSAIQNDETNLRPGNPESYRRVRGGGRLILTQTKNRLRSGIFVAGSIGAFVGASDFGSKPGNNTVKSQLSLARTLRPLRSRSSTQALPPVRLKPKYKKQLVLLAHLKKRGLSNRDISEQMGIGIRHLHASLFELRALSPISSVRTLRCGGNSQGERQLNRGSDLTSRSFHLKAALSANHSVSSGTRERSVGTTSHGAPSLDQHRKDSR